MNSRSLSLGSTVLFCALLLPAALAQKPATGEGTSVTLRQAAEARKLLVGTAVFPEGLQDQAYAGLLAREFNVLTPENAMKWDAIHPQPNEWTFDAADRLVEFAAKNHMKVTGHVLVWHQQLPEYVKSLPARELRRAMREHIGAVVGRYKGKVHAWDVVNEAIAVDGSGLRDTVFRQKLGDQYIADAFRLARQADPQALLFYNDYGGEGLNQKSDRIYDLVQGLRAQGVPIDGVGLQMHISATNPPSDASIAANMSRLASLGLFVNISEMDIRIRDLPGTVQARLEVQKLQYHSIVGVCVAEPRCDGVTFWGFTDAHSWIDAQFGADDPLLFDEQYAAKPAFYGVLDAFWRR